MEQDFNNFEGYNKHNSNDKRDDSYDLTNILSDDELKKVDAKFNKENKTDIKSTKKEHTPDEYYNAKALDRPYLGDLMHAEWDVNHQYDISYGEDWDKHQGTTANYDTTTQSGDDRLNKLANMIMDHAIKNKASDLQINAWKDFGVVKERVEGSWAPVRILHKSSVDPLIVVYRKFAGVSVNNITTPSIEGHITHSLQRPLADRPDNYDIRVAISPTINGQVLTLRFLYDKDLDEWSLDDLGYTEDELTIFKQKMQQQNGLILLSGGLGSGKSTSEETMLIKIMKDSLGSRLIMTLENPVEYATDGIVQGNIDPLHDFSFGQGTVVRLREGADVLQIGEINDEQTAREAVNLATTGQLVFSTIHSDSAINVPLALINRSKMTVDIDLLGTSLSLIIYQTLRKQLCPYCSVDHLVNSAEKKWIDEKLNLGRDIPVINIKELNEAGCDHCDHTGYSGRILISEMIDANRTYTDLLRKYPKDMPKLKSELLKESTGYYPLEYDVLRRLNEGKISITQAKELID